MIRVLVLISEPYGFNYFQISATHSALRGSVGKSFNFFGWATKYFHLQLLIIWKNLPEWPMRGSW